ncbi:MAG: hypothetical protein GX119_02460 [Syntrophomonadaceae bacterium]|nr:hypothetical protein [Syntrophomonadaceae bacterium]
MKKHGLVIMVLGALLISFGLGYMAASIEPVNKPVPGGDKALIGMETEKRVIDEQSTIKLEQEYLRCKHLLVSDFPDRNRLLGKSLEEISQLLTIDNGYTLAMEGNTLTIHQRIEDWCPEDKEKCRLKEYQGRLAVYQGPDAQNDILLRVTNIEIESLPVTIAEDIKKGRYEFDSEEALNDALENLDEY